MKTSVILLILCSFMSYMYAQENETVEKSGASSGARFLSPAIELEADVLGFVPNFSFLVDVGFYLTPKIIISPRIGFTYFMDIWDEIHDDYYFPAGVRLNLPYSTFFELMYYFPMELDFERLRLRVSAGGELFLYSGSAAALSLSAGMGTGLFYFIDTNMTYLPISFKFGLRVYF